MQRDMDSVDCRAMCYPIPTEPGVYYWDHYGCVVTVYQKRGGHQLYVKSPRGVEIRITKRIAGVFLKQDKRNVRE